MGKGKNQNPKPHKRRRHNTSNSWSELPLDLLNSVLERLTFSDFDRVKSVCSSWHSAWKQSVPKNHIPWLILFPEDNNNSCTLFNPEVKDKLYKTQDLGLDFAKSVCVATYGSWLLMRDPLYNLYILNLFTEERITLPPVESQLGVTKIKRISDDLFLISYNHNQVKGINIRSPVFWVDEGTKDYVVVWGLYEWCVLYAKKGDTSWKRIPDILDCFDMVYKDHKLYFSSFMNIFKIFDFSRDTPQETFGSSMLLYRGDGLLRFSYEPILVEKTRLVVTVTGDVLKVERLVKPRTNVVTFCVYKVYSSGTFKKHEPVDSLGDEAMLLDLGITVLANGIEGLKKNSVYCTGGLKSYPSEICVFDLETKKMELLQTFDCLSSQRARPRWFLPSFKTKCV